MMVTLTIYMILLICFLAVGTIIGRIFLNLFSDFSNRNKYENLFFSLLTGTIIISFITGIIFSSGITLQWMLASVAIFLLFEKYKNGSLSEIRLNKSLKFDLPSLPFLVSGIMIIFLWQLITHHESITDPSVVPYKDLIFYSDVSQNMMQNGNENQFLFANEWFESLNGITPYHHFELWINGIAGEISGNHLLSMIFVTNVWFLILTWLGFSALASRLRKNDDSMNLLIGLAGIWLMGLSGGLFSEIGMWRYADALMNSPSIIIFQKTAVIYPLFMAAWLLWMKGKIMESRITLLFLPVVSVATAPTTLIAIGIFSLHDLFIKKNYGNFLRSNFYLGIFTSIYFLILHFFGTSTGNLGLDSESMSVIFEKSYIADMIYFLQTIPIIHFIAVLPWLLLLSFIYWKKWNSLIEKPNLHKYSILLVFWSAAFFSWQIFNYQGADAIQFFNVIAGVVLNLACFLIFVKAIDSGNFTKIIAASFIIGGITYSYWHNEKNNHFIEYDSKYVEAVLIENKKLDNPNKAFILSANHYKESSDYHPYFKKAAWFLANDPKMDVMVNIGTDHLYDMNKWNLYQRTQWETSAFNLFSKEFRKTNPKADWGHCQFVFIEEYKIKMLFVGKNVAIPEWIESKIVKTITDPLSGEKCLILDYTSNKKY